MIYFDNAATSRYKPRAVIRALVRHTEKSANSGRGSHSAAIDAAMNIEKTRELLKETLGCNQGTTVFTKNCTEALNLAILGSDLHGRAVTTVMEHNSTLRPLYEAKSRYKLDIVTVSPKNKRFVTAADIESELSSDTSFVAVNYVSNVTGAVADIKEIGELLSDRKIPFLVDGAQAVPIFPVDMKRYLVNMLALPAHKGYHASQGVGALMFDKSIRLNPVLFGGTGISSSSVYQPKIYPEALESGTLFSAGIIALGEGVKWTQDNINELRSTTEKLAEKLIDGLDKLGVKIYTTDARAGIVSFNVGNTPSEDIANSLNEAGFAVRGGLHCAPLVHKFLGTSRQGAVRASIGINNTSRDVDALIRAVTKILDGNSG